MPPELSGGDLMAGRTGVTAQVRELLELLFPHLSGLEVSRVDGCGDAVVAFASVRGAEARCPQCGEASSRVHGRY
jgi:transposase